MSELENNLAIQIRALKLPAPEREYRFAPPLRFRFDFAWVEQMLAAEVQGGTWTNGRHSRGVGYHQDCYKANIATLAGWRVFRFTAEMVKDGTAIELLKRALKGG